jgi:uncharacterized protein
MAAAPGPAARDLGEAPTTGGRVDSLIVKIAELCNLNCRYCYIYNHEDQTYKSRPKFMAPEVFDAMLTRVKEYCERRDGHQITLTLHGGEPTLIGPERFAAYAHHAREVLGDHLANICMQTNGTLLTPEWIRVFHACRVPVSVSLDGPARVNDLNRVDHSGRGSHAAALRGLRLLQDAGFAPGILCVIDPAVSGLENYEYFRSLGVTSIDFLFPDVSWDNKERMYGSCGETPVSDYLIPIFDKWFAEDDPDVRVRVLWGLLSSLMGGTHMSDAFGNPVMAYLIIETDGSIQSLDALRVCEEGLADTQLNVVNHGFDDLHEGMPFVARIMREGVPLCQTCQQCPEVEVCGGGYLPHRYRRANGFDNPSVWCLDIQRLIAHMRSVIGLARNAPRPWLDEREGAMATASEP